MENTETTKQAPQNNMGKGKKAGKLASVAAISTVGFFIAVSMGFSFLGGLEMLILIILLILFSVGLCNESLKMKGGYGISHIAFFAAAFIPSAVLGAAALALGYVEIINEFVSGILKLSGIICFAEIGVVALLSVVYIILKKKKKI